MVKLGISFLVKELKENDVVLIYGKDHNKPISVAYKEDNRDAKITISTFWNQLESITFEDWNKKAP